MRTVGFLVTRDIVARRLGVNSGSEGGVEGAPLEGGSTLAGVRMRVVGSWQSFHKPTYFSTSAFSCSEKCLSGSGPWFSGEGPSIAGGHGETAGVG